MVSVTLGVVVATEAVTTVEVVRAAVVKVGVGEGSGGGKPHSAGR